MSYQDGWAAINLEMPKRVPHTEYSVESHWEVIKAVTGIDVSAQSAEDLQCLASQALIKTWDFDFMWSTLLGGEIFANHRTYMGHAEYAAGGVDRNDTISCPFKTPQEVLGLDFNQHYEACQPAVWVANFEDHYRRNCASFPEAVNMTGIYVTLISGLIDLLGWEMLLLAAGTDRVAFGRLANRYADYILPYFEALAASNVPLVMVHDDIVWSSGPFMAPQWYRDYLFPNYKRYFDPLLQAGKKIMFTSDGDFTLFIDDLVHTGIHGFVLEPMTDMAYIADKYGHSHSFIGNADTRILLSGGPAEIRREVERCMAIGKNCPGYFMAVGNHIPANTPVDNVLYYMQVYQELSRR